MIVSRDLFKYTPELGRDGKPVSRSRRGAEHEVTPAVDVGVTGDATWRRPSRAIEPARDRWLRRLYGPWSE